VYPHYTRRRYAKLKTFEDLCPGQSPEEVLVDYALMYFGEGEWPASVILAVLELDDPDRTFAIDLDGDEDDLCDYSDVVCVDGEPTEEELEEVAALEKRLGELKRQLLRT
jgi:hypothetical protein